MSGRAFARRHDGTVAVRLSADELTLLGKLAEQIGELLSEPDRTDPAVSRLFPRAYLDPTEDVAEREWQALAGNDLLTERLTRLGELVEMTRAAAAGPTGDELTLDAEAAHTWLVVLNDARLVLGSRLGVTDDDHLENLAPDEPRAPLGEVYRWLTHLQGDLVEVLLGE